MLQFLEVMAVYIAAGLVYYNVQHLRGKRPSWGIAVMIGLVAQAVYVTMFH